ncbi:MAG TPA: IPT/TIG domain-containing protein [Thermoanaerobaculia bacterium]|nr:IPT/TIG domain-containing protein [Thermoanaerobaculia bacterium]
MGDSRSSKAFVVAAVLLLVAAAALADPATVSSITPAQGLTRGGEIVHIHGENLIGAPLACPSITCGVFVKFGDTLATIVDNSATEIVVVAPPHDAGRVDVQVNVPVTPTITLPSAYAYQDPSPFDMVRFLVPVVINSSGAGGTNWVSELVVHNENAEALPINGSKVPPLATSIVTLTPPTGSAGSYIEVPKRLADNMTANVRVHDTTRDADGWGAEVPVVPETQFRRSIVLLAVPADARYRALLRVYGYGTNDANVTLTFRDDETGEIVGTRTLALQSGYAQVPVEGVRPRIRVQATAETSLIWAFVSVTNNTTQQVTTITPTVTPAAVALPATLAPGRWAASGVCVNVTNTTVNITAGCFNGSFAVPSIGTDGRFEMDGTFYFAGPAPINPPAAHFSGVVQGTTLTITAKSGDKTIGSWTVQLGDPTPCGPRCL